jgi:hypothetical protein
MKKIRVLGSLVILGLGIAPLFAAETETPAFPGLEKSMTPEQYEAAGLSKLDASERAKLDEFIRRYVSTSNEKVATAAVEQAVKEKKVTVAPPQVIQSRIVGPFSGYNERTVFTLENGQRWAPSQRDSQYFPKVDSPPVIILKVPIGYRMYIMGGGAFRVVRLK